MVSRAVLLSSIAGAVALAACTADPLSPSPSGTVLRDEEACDTIYVDSSVASEPLEEGDGECHIIIVWY